VIETRLKCLSIDFLFATTRDKMREQSFFRKYFEGKQQTK